MQLLACIELQIGQLVRRCAGALAGLVLATVDAAGVTLAWDPVVHPLLSGYAVYVGPAPGIYDVRYIVGNATSYEVCGSRCHCGTQQRTGNATVE